MGSLFVVLIILGCVAYQYLKGTLVKSFVVVIISICASVVAFGYFELLANFLISRKILKPWAHPLSFVMLFIVAFAVLQAIAAQLTRRPVDFGLLPERIGRVIFGIFLGLIVSGLLLTAVAMAPISPKYPYQRFDQASPDPENPNGVLLNADGFTAGWFSIVSSGSFSGKRSFAVLHPAFLDQLFLNRHEVNNNVSIVTSPEVIEIPNKAVWPAPEELKDTNGNPVLPKSGHTLTIIRIGITTRIKDEWGRFTPSQLRVICKQDDGRGPLAGKGENIYPVGYMKTKNELQIKKLNDRIEIEKDDFVSRVKEVDFAFYVPNGFKPVLVEFKQNYIGQLPPPVSAEQAPPIVPFVRQPEPAAPVNASETPVERPSSPTPPNEPETSSRRPGLSNVGKSIIGGQLDEDQ